MDFKALGDTLCKHDISVEDLFPNSQFKIEDFPLQKLTQKENDYFRMMFPKSGVLYLRSAPGLGKTAVLEKMAQKLNLFYIDIRLSQMDEIDVGLYPSKKKIIVHYTLKGSETTKEEEFLTHIIPEWAFLANNPPEGYKGCLIVYEELNRAPLAVRNAALQILLERRIGFTGFNFKENVFMAATGNLGAEDDTDVEDFDSALRNRLLPVEHKMNYKEWRQAWAQEHIHPLIMGFLATEGSEYYHFIPQNEDSAKRKETYITPRSWTFLSDFLVANYGKNCNYKDFKELTQRRGSSYVGGVALNRFLNYCEDMEKVSFTDILEKYQQIRDKISLGRSKCSEFLTKLKKVDLDKLNSKQTENVKLFILDLRKDESASFFLKVIKEQYHDHKTDRTQDELENKTVLNFLRDKRFEQIINIIENSIRKMLEEPVS
jgi:hypothetical protein